MQTITRVIAATAIGGLVIAGCSSMEAEPEPPPAPASDEPADGGEEDGDDEEQLREPTPVEGVRTITDERVSNQQALGLSAEPQAAAEDVDAVANAVGDWLDAHLTALAEGPDGAWEQVAADGLEPNPAATTALADPDNHVTEASYDLNVQHGAAPRLVEAAVQVTREDGSEAAVDLLFAVDDLEVSLTSVGLPTEPVLAGSDPYVLLVMGTDMGPPDRSGHIHVGRADVLQLLVVDGAREHVTILGFPRDSWVNVQGRGNRRINELLLPGPEAAMQTMENVTGLEVDDWIATGFAGYIQGVDTFGGVNIEVERSLTNTGGPINLAAGQQQLNGAQMLAFNRDRKSRPQGDIDRSAAAGRALAAIHRDLLERTSSPAELANHLGTLFAHTDSSLRMDRAMQLAATALTIDPANVHTTVVPVRLGWAGEASVVFLQPGAEAMFERLATDGYID